MDSTELHFYGKVHYDVREMFGVDDGVADFLIVSPFVLWATLVLTAVIILVLNVSYMAAQWPYILGCLGLVLIIIAGLVSYNNGFTPELLIMVILTIPNILMFTVTILAIVNVV